jgi:hypothetical protein
MQRALHLLGLILLLCVFSDARSAELPPTPRLLLDQKDIDSLKSRIEGSFAKQWKDYKEQVDRVMNQAIALPPRGGNWSHNYVCPEHGARLRQGKKIGQWQWEHICPVGPHTLRGDPSKATTDFDGNGIMAAHLDYAEQLISLGVVYQVTRDEKYAKRSREILLAYADKYESYPLHDNQGRPGSGGHVASQSLTEASWLINVVQGADLVWSTLSDADRKTIEQKLLRPPLDEIIIPKVYGIHNIQCRHNSAIGLVGFLLNDPKLIHRAIDDEKTGFRQQIAKGVRDDGMWEEGASGYHFFTIDGLWPLAEAARHCGIDLYSNRFKSMFDGPLALAMPDMRLPNFNDSGVVDLVSRADQYELAYARWRDPQFAAIAARGDRTGRLPLLYGVDVLPTNTHGSAVGQASRNLTASGYAILQRGSDDDATWLCLKYGPHGGAHGHFDKNHFILYSHGQILMPDAGTHAYGSPLHAAWDKHSLAHNTLTIDEKTQDPAEGKCLAFGTSDGIDYAVTDAGDIDKDSPVHFTRSIAMIDPNTIVVIDQIRAEKEHTYDLALHFTGKWTDLLDGRAWSAPKKNGYSVLDDLTTRTIHDATTLTVTFTVTPPNNSKPNRSQSVGLEKLTLLNPEETELITGTGVGESTRDRVPIALLRRRAKNTCYIWGLSLIGKPLDLQRLKMTSPDGRDLDASDAVAVRISSSDGPVILAAAPFATDAQLIVGSRIWKSAAPFSTIRDAK